MTKNRSFKVASTLTALSVMGLALMVMTPAASAEGIACSTYHTTTTQGGSGTTEHYGQDCPVALNEGGHTLCIGYHEETTNHYNDPNERSSTTYSESCDTGVGALRNLM